MRIIYKMVSKSMVRRIVLLLCRALCKDLQDYSVTKKRKGRSCDGYVAIVTVPELPDGIIYQQDGATPHFSNIVRTELEQ